jgi:cold shock CspA family protein
LSFLVENNPVYSNIELDYIDFENDINKARDNAIESITIESDSHTLNTEQYVCSKMTEDPFVDSEGFQLIYLTNKNGHDSNDIFIHTKKFLNTLKDGMSVGFYLYIRWFILIIRRV